MSFTYVPPKREDIYYIPYTETYFEEIQGRLVRMMSCYLSAMKAVHALQTARADYYNEVFQQGGPVVNINEKSNWVYERDEQIMVSGHRIRFDRNKDYKLVDCINSTEILLHTIKTCTRSDTVLFPMYLSAHPNGEIFVLKTVNLEKINTYALSQTEGYYSIEFDFSTGEDSWLNAILRYSNSDMLLLTLGHLFSTSEVGILDSLTLDALPLMHEEEMIKIEEAYSKHSTIINTLAMRINNLIDKYKNNDMKLFASPDVLCSYIRDGLDADCRASWTVWAA